MGRHFLIPLPPNHFFHLGPQRDMPSFVKIGWKMRSYYWPQTDRSTHGQTKLILLSVPCYCIATGQIIKSHIS